MFLCGSKKIFNLHKKIESYRKLKRVIRTFVAKYQQKHIAKNL